MDFNPKLIQLSEKWKAFHNDPTPGQIMTTICPYTYDLDYSAFGIAPRPLSSWNFETDAKEFVLRQKKMHDIFMEHTKDLDNDYFPALNVNLGYGVNSAYVTGLPVTFGEDTSWVHHLIEDWDEDMPKLRLDENNYWYRKVLEMTKMFVDMQNGDYAVSGFPNAGPGDMANAIRGNEIFTDLYDEPERVFELMAFCVGAAQWLEDGIRGVAGDVNGGTVSANCWFEGLAPYISLDFNDLCSPQVFREFDFKTTQMLLDIYKGAYIHHHMKGYHIHADVAKLKHLKMLEISWDPGLPKPVSLLPEILEMHNGLPLMVRCTAQDVYEYIDDLKKGRVVIMLNINNLDEGREVMKFIRKNSII